MQENVNRCKRNGRFLCEDEIHLQAVSRNTENMTQLVLFWGLSPDFPMSCCLKPRYFDTARTIRDFVIDSDMISVQKVKVGDLVTYRNTYFCS